MAGRGGGERSSSKRARRKKRREEAVGRSWAGLLFSPQGSPLLGPKAMRSDRRVGCRSALRTGEQLAEKKRGTGGWPSHGGEEARRRDGWLAAISSMVYGKLKRCGAPVCGRGEGRRVVEGLVRLLQGGLRGVDVGAAVGTTLHKQDGRFVSLQPRN